MNPFKYVDIRKLRSDEERLKLIDKENKEILKAINTVNRTIVRPQPLSTLTYTLKFREE